jgi:hypothetical protein
MKQLRGIKCFEPRPQEESRGQFILFITGLAPAWIHGEVEQVQLSNVGGSQDEM